MYWLCANIQFFAVDFVDGTNIVIIVLQIPMNFYLEMCYDI
jgi:hypothetical protein